MLGKKIGILAVCLMAGLSACAPSVTEASDQVTAVQTADETDAEPEGPASDTTAQATSEAETTPTALVEMYVTRLGVNVRSSAELGDNVIGTMDFGDSVQATGITVDDRWVQIIQDGKKAYIAKEFLSETKPEETEPAAETSESTVAGSEDAASGTPIGLDSSWKYAENSAIHSGQAVLYKAVSNRKGITVCVNAGHGCSGGESVKTLSHPDGSPKVTGGTNGAGAVKSLAISSGMTFSDGTPEAKVNLAVAKKLKSRLLSAGYDVLMIRESDDVQLDNIARTVIANNNADCHIAIHFDSTTSNKGAFFMSVPDGSYKSMEPVASHWQEHEKLGSSLIQGLESSGVKIFSGGSMDTDLTQTSYSTIPSVDIELGDKASGHDDASLDQLADGLLQGINIYFGQ